MKQERLLVHESKDGRCNEKDGCKRGQRQRRTWQERCGTQESFWSGGTDVGKATGERGFVVSNGQEKNLPIQGLTSGRAKVVQESSVSTRH